MMKQTKRVIAEVESSSDDSKLEFDVTDERAITIRFPNSVYAAFGSGPSAFTKKLTPDQARTIGRELIDAADRVTSAEHVNV